MQPAEAEGLWESHVDAFGAFLSVSRQWRTVGGGWGGVSWLGLDYAAVRSGLDLAGIEVTPELWGQLREIEAGALAVMNGT